MRHTLRNASGEYRRMKPLNQNSQTMALPVAVREVKPGKSGKGRRSSSAPRPASYRTVSCACRELANSTGAKPKATQVDIFWE